jgi:hypothetical protein
MLDLLITDIGPPAKPEAGDHKTIAPKLRETLIAGGNSQRTDPLYHFAVGTSGTSFSSRKSRGGIGIEEPVSRSPFSHETL